MATSSKGPGWFLAWLLAAAIAAAFPEAAESGSRTSGIYLARHDVLPMRAICVPAAEDDRGNRLAACMATDGRRVVFLICDPWECEEP